MPDAIFVNLPNKQKKKSQPMVSQENGNFAMTMQI